MNIRHVSRTVAIASLACGFLTLVSLAHAEREVFAPNRVAPTTTAAGGAMTFSATAPFWTGANISANNNFGIGPTTASVLTFHTNGSERTRITSTGEVFIGNGETAASVANGTLRATGGSGTNIGGADLVINGGRSTGSAAGGSVRLFTSPTGSSGTSVNASVERMRINSTGQVYLGNGETSATPANSEIRATNGSGTNVSGANLSIYPGISTGSGNGGVIAFFTNAPGASGASLNNSAERVRVKQGGQVRFVPLAAAPTLDVENGDVYYNSTTNKLQVRAAGAWVDLH
jgi:hypothetical protein